MSDIAFPDSWGYLIILGFLLYFLVGFIPGFYLSYLFILKRVKKINFYITLLYFIFGTVCGLISIFYVSSILVALSLQYRYLNIYLNPISIISLEIIVILIHFFYFLKQKGKKNNK